MTGRLLAIVGPSGVGKDTVMQGLVAASPAFAIQRRVITRAAGLGGEIFEAVSGTEFERRHKDGAFCLSWSAHGLRYAIPATARDTVAAGTHLLVNLSRAALPAAERVFPDLRVVHLTASRKTLTARLARRGRESPQEIAQRLARADQPLPEGLDVVTISNDGSIDQTVHAALAQLQPLRGQ